MGCLSSKNIEEEYNRKIDESQKSFQKKLEKHNDLLILGTGISGKTTFRKQLGHIEQQAFAEEEDREGFSPIVIMDILEGFLAALRTYPGKEALVNEIKIELSEMAAFLTPEMEKKLVDLLKDDFFQQQVGINKIDIQDCWFVFTDTLCQKPGYFKEDWIPTVDECVRARARTTGFSKTELEVDGKTFVIYDVGGQRSERRKWLHMFQEVKAAIYVCAMSEYDSVLFEDRSKNCLEESLDLWADCINSQWLQSAPVILFLNKHDLFMKKFFQDKIPLNSSGLFPDAPGLSSTEDEVIQWFSNKFLSKMKTGQERVKVFVLTATSSEDVRRVFDQCRGLISATGD